MDPMLERTVLVYVADGIRRKLSSRSRERYKKKSYCLVTMLPDNVFATIKLYWVSSNGTERIQTIDWV